MRKHWDGILVEWDSAELEPGIRLHAASLARANALSCSSTATRRVAPTTTEKNGYWSTGC